METTIGSFETEQIHRHGPWRDLAEVEVAAFEWVDFSNTDRPHEYLDDLTPCQAAAVLLDAQFAITAVHLACFGTKRSQIQGWLPDY